MTQIVTDKRTRTTVALSATVVPGVSTDMLTISTKFISRLFVHLTVAVAALTGFSIKAKSTPDAANDTLYSVSGDYTTPTGLLVGCSADLTGLAVGSGWFIIDTTGLESITIAATSGGSATLAIEAGGAT